METYEAIERSPVRGLRLLVMAQTQMITYPLPPVGEVQIGCAPECQVRIGQPGIARFHALLRTGPMITLTDTSNGGSTAVGGRKLTPGESVSIAPGVVVLLGNVPVVVQRATSTRLRQVRSHDWFESRLRDHCARAGSAGGCFGVVRVKFRSDQGLTLEEAFTAHLRDSDSVALYAADEYELLLADTSPAMAAAVCSRLQEHVSANHGGALRIGLACWPDAGRSPEALLAAAGEFRDDGRQAAECTLTKAGAIERLGPLLERVAPTNINVLILGETGVGKELLARRIHQMSSRANGPMLCINCAALPEALLESELFGYERGAFTGAVRAKAGLLEAAQGGTVLLDEVGELPAALQAKLLRVVEQRQATRLGGLKARDVNVRFFAATNRDLETEVANGAFRPDLYFRLCGISLTLPPLRERVDEIEPLAEGFIAEFSRQAGVLRPPVLSRAALRLLERYGWPGNVRELRNVIEQAVTLCGDDVIDLGHLPLERLTRTPTLDPRSEPTPGVPWSANDARAAAGESAHPEPVQNPIVQAASDLWSCADQSPQALNRVRVQHALERCAGNQTHAARLLGISRRSLITLIERYDLPRPRKCDSGSRG